MSDVTKWKVHGPVKTLRTEFATWDIEKEEWQQRHYWTLTSFRPDGSVSETEHHNSDGSIAYSRWVYDQAGKPQETHFWIDEANVDKTAYFYDEAGRLERKSRVGQDGSFTDTEVCTYDGGLRTRTRILDRPGIDCYGIEGTELAYGAPGAARMILVDDQNDLPAEVIFEDAYGNSLQKVVLTRDVSSRLVKEEMRLSAQAFGSFMGNAPSEDRAELKTLLEKTFGETFLSTAYAYDSRGRLIERRTTMGTLSETRKTFQYDDRDDPVEETTEERSHELIKGDDGSVQTSTDRVSTQHNRYDHVYDSQGNWTERIVSYRLESNPDFLRSNIERRVITYY